MRCRTGIKRRSRSAALGESWKSSILKEHLGVLLLRNPRHASCVVHCSSQSSWNLNVQSLSCGLMGSEEKKQVGQVSEVAEQDSAGHVES